MLALERLSADRSSFEKTLKALPFGSRIVIEEISFDIERININISPDFRIERQLLSVKALQSMWRLPESLWPPSLSLDHLEHHHQLNEHPIYSDPPNGYHKAWNLLDHSKQEAAMVFSLGKMLCCIFEGASCPRNSLPVEPKYGCLLEFPTLQRTPAKLQQLVRQCTTGSYEWKGSKFYPRGRSGVNGEAAANAVEAMDAAKTMWKGKVEDLELFLEAKPRWRAGTEV